MTTFILEVDVDPRKFDDEDAALSYAKTLATYLAEWAHDLDEDTKSIHVTTIFPEDNS